MAVAPALDDAAASPANATNANDTSGDDAGALDFGVTPIDFAVDLGLPPGE